MFLSEIAASPPQEWIPPILNLGASGWIIYWLTSKLSLDVRRMTDALNASTRTQLLQLLVHPRFPEEAKPIAKEILNELDKK